MPSLKLKPSTDNYCLAGNPVSHSKSPIIHSAFAEQTGQDMYFQLICVERDGFSAFLEEFRTLGGKGMNITLPFKEEAWQLSGKLTARATAARAVNTIKIEEGGAILGDNTDGIGLVHDLLQNHNIKIENSGVLILGAGGAARGIIGPILSCHPERMVIANRTVTRAQELSESFAGEGNVTACGYEDLSGQVFNLVINATSASLQNEVPPVPDNILDDKACCYDLMYSDKETVFVSWAREHGASRSMDGLGMLVEQAAESFYLWRGVRPDTAAVIDMMRQKMNSD